MGEVKRGITILGGTRGGRHLEIPAKNRMRWGKSSGDDRTGKENKATLEVVDAASGP